MHRNNRKKTWETIGQILKNKNRKTTVTDTFITSISGMPCTDYTYIANNFNTYFTTVGNTLAANVPQTDNHSLILSHLQYCTLLWANSYYSHLHKLRLLQKKAIRILSNTDYRAHSSKLFLKLKLLKLDDIMTFQLGTFMYKLKNNKLPSMIPHNIMFITNENIHSHNTRNKEGYLIPSVRTNCRKFTVSYAGPILWNSFPQQLRQLPSEALFKKKLKSTLLAT